jgi:hypothetical protein
VILVHLHALARNLPDCAWPISGVSASDATFLVSGLTAASRSYAPNSLNQYASAGATAYTYDTNGNLTSDGVWTYTSEYPHEHAFYAADGFKDVLRPSRGSGIDYRFDDDAGPQFARGLGFALRGAMPNPHFSNTSGNAASAR